MISPILKKRVYAYTTDLFVILISNYFLTASFTNFLKVVFFSLPIKTQLLLIQKLNMMTSVSLILLSFSYFSLFYYLTNGKTFGKAIFGLRVKGQSEELTLFESSKRAFAYFFCNMTGSFLFAIPFLRKDEKGLADFFSKTNVVIDEVAPLKQTEFQLTLLESIQEEQDILDEPTKENAA